jgi:hypothetical protein
MNLDQGLLFEKLKPAQRVLIAGIGGGYDVYCGLPLFFHLRKCGKEVQLANLSFTHLHAVDGRKLAWAATEVTADSRGPSDYFPEKYLCEWFRLRGEDVSIHSFHRTGVRPLAEAYSAVTKEYEIDTILLVDGGTDSLMRGDEPDLGTPEEDIASIAAVDSLDVERRSLVCIGFGVDTFHGVSHGCVLENVAALAKAGAFLGAFSLLACMEEARLYREAAAFAFSKMPEHPSIVSSSILSAIAGEFGDHHTTERTKGSKLWINPLMSMYWAFTVEGVARRCIYLDDVRDTESYDDLSQAIAACRNSMPLKRKWERIPL